MFGLQDNCLIKRKCRRFSIGKDSRNIACSWMNVIFNTVFDSSIFKALKGVFVDDVVTREVVSTNG